MPQHGRNRNTTVTHRLEVLLDLRVECPSLYGDDLGCGIRIMSDGGSALGAEETPDCIAGRARALPLLDGSVDGQLLLGNDGDES